MSKLAETPEEYTKEFVKAFSDLDEKKIKAHMKKYGIVNPSSPIVFWTAVYKSITGGTKFPMKVRRKAKKWLLKRGFQSKDDGDVLV